MDECALGSDGCHDNATCTNTVGSYTCQCKEGFTGNGVDCEGKRKTDFLFSISVLHKGKFF